MRSVLGGYGWLRSPTIWIVLVVASSASSAHGWPGYDWEAWKKVTTWEKPDVRTDQAGRKELVRLLDVAGEKPGRIDGIRGWEKRRAEMRDVIEKILGEPTNIQKPDRPEVEVLGEEKLADHVRRHIRIRTEADDWIPAYLLLPKNLPADPVPAMICLHQTVAPGKKEPCGMWGNPDLFFALELVRQGYVCIAPDVIGFGERIPPGTQPYHDALAFYKKHPKWSFMGKMIWDVGRVIDYLETLPFVDAGRIGSIGHSHGAYGTLFAAAFEPRISLAIASCGFTTFRADPSPNRWSHLTALIPQLGTYFPDVADIPFDWQHVCAMIAPRSLFVWYATKDSIFPNTENLDDLLTDVRRVYGLYGSAGEIDWHAFDGEHRFPKDGRELAYKWLNERFRPHGDIKKIPKDRASWESRRETIRRLIRRDLGVMPKKPASPTVTVLERKSLPKYERRLIEYRVEDSERVRAYLCVPNERNGPRPGVLVLHQTTKEGKREAVGIAGDASLAFGSELAERGYVTLSPDSITAGERIDSYGPFDTRGHYLRHPSTSAMGKMLFDAQRGLDVLCSRKEVDANRIGTIGHSLGAEEALMLGAFDERVRAVVTSCGYATFSADKNRLRWARDHWFSYMPRLRPVFQAGRLPAWDWGDVVRLVAPRGVYQHTRSGDNIFPESRSAYEAGEVARGVWALYDAPADRLVNVLKPGKHGISAETKTEIYAWLDGQLKPSP